MSDTTRFKIFRNRSKTEIIAYAFKKEETGWLWFSFNFKGRWIQYTKDYALMSEERVRLHFSPSTIWEERDLTDEEFFIEAL